MKQSFKISANSIPNAFGEGTRYCPLPQNAGYIFELAEDNNLKIHGIDQRSDREWILHMTGIDENFHKFLKQFIIDAKEYYRIETW